MSLILDALKKLDREKIERVAEKANVTAGILKAGDMPRRRNILPLAVALGSTACVAAIVTWFFIGEHVPRFATQPIVPAAPVQARTAASVPAKPSPSTSVEPAAMPTTSPLRAPSQEVVANVTPATATGRGAPIAKKNPPAGELVSRGETAGNDETVAAPSLKVSGIVWQDLPADRKAVINGRVAKEGDTVEGVKVLEIYPTFVSVSFKGKSFKVKMFD